MQEGGRLACDELLEAGLAHLRVGLSDEGDQARLRHRIARLELESALVEADRLLRIGRAAWRWQPGPASRRCSVHRPASALRYSASASSRLPVLQRLIRFTDAWSELAWRGVTPRLVLICCSSVWTAVTGAVLAGEDCRGGGPESRVSAAAPDRGTRQQAAGWCLWQRRVSLPRTSAEDLNRRVPSAQATSEPALPLVLLAAAVDAGSCWAPTRSGPDPATAGVGGVAVMLARAARRRWRRV